MKMRTARFTYNIASLESQNTDSLFSLAKSSVLECNLENLGA
jgi:hypothetical protein